MVGSSFETGLIRGLSLFFPYLPKVFIFHMLNFFMPQLKLNEKSPLQLMIGAIITAVCGTIVFLIFTGLLLFSFFDKFRSSQLYPFSAFIIMIAFLTIMMYRNIKLKLFYSQYLILFAIFASSFFLIQTFEWTEALKGGIFDRGGNRLLAFSDMVFPFISITFYLHYEQLNSGKFRYLGYNLIGAGILPMILFSLGLVFASSQDTYELMINEYFVLFGLSVVITSLYSTYVAGKVVYRSNNPETVIPSFIQFTGTIWLVLNFMLTSVFGDKEFSFSLFGNDLPFRVFDVPHFTIAVVILLSAYTFFPHFIYVLPFEANELLVIRMGGVPMYYYSLDEKGSNDIGDSMLKSGAIVGISAITKEILETSTALKMIQLENRILKVHQVENTLFCIIAERTSRVLENALYNFAMAFEKRYKDEMTSISGDVSVFEDANELVYQYFPFAHRE